MKTSKTLFRIVTIILAVTLITACSKENRKARFLGEADNYFKTGNYDKAKLTYLNVLRLDPQNALAFERIGAMWLEEDVPLRAGAFLAKASELAPNNAENRLRLARYYVTVGQVAEAKKEALKVIEQSPENGDAIIVLTDAARSKEDIEAAEQQLQKFPQKDNISFHLASANLFLRKGDLASAENALKRALIVDPKSTAAHTAMGVLRLFQKDTKQAGEEFKTAADLAPARSTERLKYAEFKAGTGDAEEAKKVLTEMTKQAPDYLPAWCLLADISFKNKKYDEALSLLENVFGRDPENIDGRRLEGEVRLTKGETKKAIAVLERLDQTYPRVPIIKFQLGRAYLQDNNINRANVALTQAISANPNYADAILLLAELNIRTGHAEMVIAPITDLLKKAPALLRARMLLAEAYRSLGRLDDSAAAIREQIKLAPDDQQPQVLLGLVLRQAKKNDEARKALEKAAELAPDNLMPVDQLVELDLLDKNFAAARQRVQRHFQKAPDSAAAHFLEGKILVAEGKLDPAEAAFQKTLELDPNFSSAYDLLVQTYIATNKLPQASSELQAFLDKHPENVAALMVLALIYERMNDFPNARDAYEKVLSKSPDFALALNNLAYLYAERLNNLDKAYELAQKARDLQPTEASISDTLGWVLYKRGDYQQALTILRESAQKAPDNPEVQFHLGMASYMMGQTEAARAALQKAASTKIDFPAKEEAKQRLALLEGNTQEQLPILQLEQMAKQQPNDLLAQMRLGEAYEKQGESTKAAAAYEQALKLNPKLVAAMTKLAQLNAGPLQNKERALEYARKARELAPADPQVAAILGKIAYQCGNFAWSYSLLQDAARQLTSEAAIQYDLAWAAYSLGRVAEAQRAMQTALKAKPDSPQSANARQFLAITALDETPKDLAASEPEVQKILNSSNADYVPALMAKAALQAQRGQTKPATETYIDILRRLPDFAPAQKRLAALYAEDPANTAAAYDLVTKARKTLPDDPELAASLGQISYQRKEYSRAVQLLQESSRKKPLTPKSLFYLGMSQLQAKQKTEAREALNQALTAGLQEPQATEAKRALADL
jgi:tetratricopeptide (TPR) repeat protein